MRNYRSIQGVIVTLAIVGLAACASSAGGGTDVAEPAGNGISIQVTNDTPTNIVVWAVPETGTRRRLGPVSPNGRRSFSYSPQLESMEVYLVAVPEGPASGTMGQVAERKSNPFRVLGVQTVTWSVSQQNVRIGG
ncbi:MAG: hypothetical protein MUO50_11335 [Longimicrobiales bacterium]|nr:hypothetical protein [Longimicrobiales bacterium]